MIHTNSAGSWYEQTLTATDADDDQATVTVAASPTEYGADVQLDVRAWGVSATAYLAPADVDALIAALTAARQYATEPQ